MGVEKTFGSNHNDDIIADNECLLNATYKAKAFMYISKPQHYITLNH